MLSDLEYALTQTGLKFAHYGWSKAPSGDYGVYAEDGANYLRADNKSAEKVVECTVDWFTRNPNSSAPSDIEEAFDSIPCAWSVNSIQFEEDTGFIHYEWVVQV